MENVDEDPDEDDDDEDNDEGGAVDDLIQSCHIKMVSKQEDIQVGNIVALAPSG